MKKNINIFLIIIILVLQYSIIANNKHTIIYNVRNNYLEGNNSLILPSNYKIDEEKKIISRIDSGITVNEFIDKITTNGTLSVLDNNNKVDNNIIVKTGNVLRVEYSLNNVINYKLSVIGDVISEGNISLNGAKKIAEHIVDKNIFTENSFLLAADYDGNDSIRINDVTKIVRKIKKSSITLTASFIVQDNKAASVSTSEVSCTTTSDIKKCEITAPTLTAKNGYTVIGWNTDKNAKSAQISSGGKKSITKNITYYAILYNNNGESMKIGNAVIEFEKGLPVNIYSLYVDVFETIYEQMPMLYDMNGKIEVLSSDTYVNDTKISSLCSANSAGCTFINTYSLNSEIKLKTGYTDRYQTLHAAVHELSHAFDATYGLHTKMWLRDKKDFNDLFKKYSAMEASKRPISTYAYTNIKEFVAESITIYNSKNHYQNEYSKYQGNNPISDELYKVVDKYICIAKNKYNENATACK